VGLAGARANLIPGVALQIFAGALVAGYFLLPSVQGALSSFAQWRSDAGIVASFLGTGIFGGLIPFLFLRFYAGESSARPSWIVGWFLTLFWGLRGIDVDLLYRFQAWLFGTENTVGILAAKVIFDQFVVCVIWSVPITALAYAYKDADFRWETVRADLDGTWYRRRVFPMLVSNFAVWIPTCALIYSLPLALQVPLFNLVLCFFTLLLAHVARHTHDTARRPSA
jgi:hypothetical protein